MFCYLKNFNFQFQLFFFIHKSNDKNKSFLMKSENFFDWFFEVCFLFSRIVDLLNRENA